MKSFLAIILFITFIFLSCGKEEIPKSSLIIKNNLLYKRDSDTPFTGREKALVNNKIIEYDVKDGFKHGSFRIYSVDGQIEVQGQLDSNRNVGKWQYFFMDGKIESEGNFNFDQPDGKWIWNYSNGKPKETGVYKNGIRVGMWYHYDENGKIILEKNYDLEIFKSDSSAI